MVTGDHPLTAAAIARKIGLITLPTREELQRARGGDGAMVDESEVGAMVVHGAHIANMTDKDWDVLLKKKQVVFARTSPEQKLIIVRKFTGRAGL